MLTFSKGCSTPKKKKSTGCKAQFTKKKKGLKMDPVSEQLKHSNTNVDLIRNRKLGTFIPSS